MTQIAENWLSDPATQSITQALTRAGVAVYFVGGCVRDSLLKRPISDVDIATDAEPTEVTRICEQSNLRVIPTGIHHGTVTVISDGKAYQITTFRRDVKTDGRRAQVAYSSSLETDARRRDFTMNALYCTPEGKVIDVVNGIHDLTEGKVRFVGNPKDRIKEDLLRSLRLFRFFAWYGNPKIGIDKAARTAVTQNLDQLATLSRERVGAEVLRLLAAKNPTPAITIMEETGILQIILPRACVKHLVALVNLGVESDPVQRLAAFGGDRQEPLRLSNRDANRVRRLQQIAESDESPELLGYRYGALDAVSGLELRAARSQTRLTSSKRKAAIAGSRHRFPVRSRDLSDRFTGAQLGKALKRLEGRWIASGFSLTRSELLKSVEAVEDFI
ncbi:MAG: CCA tRNA nucleotidyltransferase [Aestuariivita sp.]|nr:CCA tRNA nucleotidyltransferase [Aestuariivita sp.]MCY4202045.1 CCA tRNA nucleotidyltransferase [Aestuariivita sp.]